MRLIIPTRLLVALTAVALAAAAYPSADQYSQRREQRNDYRSGENATELRELLLSWGIDTRTPARRGDIQVETEDAEARRRGDVPSSLLRRAKRNAGGEGSWGYAEERARMEEMRRRQWQQQERRRAEANDLLRSRRPQLAEHRRNEQPEQPGQDPAADDRNLPYEERLRNWQRAKEEYEQRNRRRNGDQRQRAGTSPSPAELDPRLQEYIRRNTPIDLRAAAPESKRPTQRQRDEQQKRLRDQEEQRRRTPVDTERSQQELRQAEPRVARPPVSARIIIRNESRPLLSFRQRPESTIDFTGLSQGRMSPAAAAAAGARHEVPSSSSSSSPSHCVWAIVVCCRAHAGKSIDKLGRCFEATDCLAVPWDVAACEPAKVKAANDEIRRFYLQSAY